MDWILTFFYRPYLGSCLHETNHLSQQYQLLVPCRYVSLWFCGCLYGCLLPGVGSPHFFWSEQKAGEGRVYTCGISAFSRFFVRCFLQNACLMMLKGMVVVYMPNFPWELFPSPSAVLCTRECWCYYFLGYHDAVVDNLRLDVSLMTVMVSLLYRAVSTSIQSSHFCPCHLVTFIILPLNSNSNSYACINAIDAYNLN